MRVPKRPLASQEVQKLLSTRGGMIAVAGLVAVLAGAMLMLFLNQYRQSVDNSGKTVTALVASSLIEKGSPGDVIASKGLFETTSIKQGERKGGAITDPSALRGKVATGDIYPGEQLTSRDFATATDTVANKVADFDRAISIPLDAAHGMIGDVKTGDRVDVLAGFNVDSGFGRPRPFLKAIMQNALVLRAPDSPKAGMNGPNAQQNVVLRAPDKKAWEFAYSSEYGKVWIVLRPKAGAESSRPSLVTLEKLLFGIKPVSVKRLLRQAARR
jgi:Flp pilus assembly protein CpaB